VGGINENDSITKLRLIGLQKMGKLACLILRVSWNIMCSVCSCRRRFAVHPSSKNERQCKEYREFRV